MTLKDCQRLAVISNDPDTPKTAKDRQRHSTTIWKPGLRNREVIAFIVAATRFNSRPQLIIHGFRQVLYCFNQTDLLILWFAPISNSYD